MFILFYTLVASVVNPSHGFILPTENYSNVVPYCYYVTQSTMSIVFLCIEFIFTLLVIKVKPIHEYMGYMDVCITVYRPTTNSGVFCLFLWRCD